jgi:hypothetical protein
MDDINPMASGHDTAELRRSIKLYRDLTLYLLLFILFDAKIAIALAACHVIRLRCMPLVPAELVELLHSYLQV